MSSWFPESPALVVNGYYFPLSSSIILSPTMDSPLIQESAEQNCSPIYSHHYADNNSSPAGISSDDEMARPTSSCSVSSNASSGEVRRLPKPPTDNKMYQPSRYKTELCRIYEEFGSCTHGDKCLYAHGKFELNPMKGRHPKFKTKPCIAFHTEGYCSYGPRCTFIHTKPDAEKVLESILSLVETPPMPENPKSLKEPEVVNIGLTEGCVDINGINFGSIDCISDKQDYDRLPVFTKLCQRD